MISREQVYSTVPVLSPQPTDEISDRVYLRYGLSSEYEPEEVRPIVARRLRDLRRQGRVCGGPRGWLRAQR